MNIAVNITKLICLIIMTILLALSVLKLFFSKSFVLSWNSWLLSLSQSVHKHLLSWSLGFCDLFLSYILLFVYLTGNYYSNKRSKTTSLVNLSAVVLQGYWKKDALLDLSGFLNQNKISSAFMLNKFICSIFILFKEPNIRERCNQQSSVVQDFQISKFIISILLYLCTATSVVPWCLLLLNFF